MDRYAWLGQLHDVEGGTMRWPWSGLEGTHYSTRGWETWAWSPGPRIVPAAASVSSVLGDGLSQEKVILKPVLFLL